MRSSGGLASEAIFQFLAGGAKGTRFMFGMAAIVEGVGPQFAEGAGPSFARTAAFNGDGGSVDPRASRRQGLPAASRDRKARFDAMVAALKASKKP